MIKGNVVANLKLKSLLYCNLGGELKNFTAGDTLYVTYLTIDRRKRKYFFKLREFFGKCIAFRNRLFKTSVILRKAVKLNEVEQIFVLDSPFIVALGIKKAHKTRFKKLLFLRKYSGKYSRVRLHAGFKKKIDE